MPNFFVDLVEHLSFRESRWSFGRSGAKGMQPLGGVGKRGGKIPANQNEGKSSDEQRLNKGGKERGAEAKHDAILNITGVVNHDERAGDLTVLMNGEGIKMKRRTGYGNKIGDAFVELCGSLCL